MFVCFLGVAETLELWERAEISRNRTDIEKQFTMMHAPRKIKLGNLTTSRDIEGSGCSSLFDPIIPTSYDGINTSWYWSMATFPSRLRIPWSPHQTFLIFLTSTRQLWKEYISTEIKSFPTENKIQLEWIEDSNARQIAIRKENELKNNRKKNTGPEIIECMNQSIKQSRAPAKCWIQRIMLPWHLAPFLL